MLSGNVIESDARLYFGNRYNWVKGFLLGWCRTSERDREKNGAKNNDQRPCRGTGVAKSSRHGDFVPRARLRVTLRADAVWVNSQRVLWMWQVCPRSRCFVLNMFWARQGFLVARVKQRC